METKDSYELLAALRYCNAQLSALFLAVENPEFYNLDGTLSDSHKTFARVNKLQLSVLDKYNIYLANLPTYSWGNDE